METYPTPLQHSDRIKNSCVQLKTVLQIHDILGVDPDPGLRIHGSD